MRQLVVEEIEILLKAVKAWETKDVNSALTFTTRNSLLKGGKHA